LFLSYAFKIHKMNIFNEVVGHMNKEEVRHLKLFLARTNDHSDRKDVQLFDLVRRHYPEYEEEKICRQLYGHKNKNVLYRLKNRLLEDIGKSMCLHYFENDAQVESQNYLALSRIYQSKRQFDIAFFYLKKAERKSVELYSAELADIIYGEYIKLAQETDSINPEKYIAKRKENRKELFRLQEIDDILAVLRYRILVSQNFSTHNVKVLEVMKKTINEYSRSEGLKHSPQLRFKVYHALSRILLQQHDFVSLEQYLLATYSSFIKENLFNKANHETKLQMLTYLINSLFKNGKIKQSLQYTALLKSAMEEYSALLKEKYMFYYYNSLVINYTATDKEKAIEILEQAREDKIIRQLPLYLVFIYGNLAVISFDLRKNKEALKYLVQMRLQKSFANLDEAMRLKFSFAEMIIRYELEDFDYLEKLLVQTGKMFTTLLQSAEYKREKMLLQILGEMMVTPNVTKNKKLAGKARKFLGIISSKEAADMDIVNYNDWLSTKFN
jgi:hypothetical protein